MQGAGETSGLKRLGGVLRPSAWLPTLRLFSYRCGTEWTFSSHSNLRWAVAHRSAERRLRATQEVRPRNNYPGAEDGGERGWVAKGKGGLQEQTEHERWQ